MSTTISMNWTVKPSRFGMPARRRATCATPATVVTIAAGLVDDAYVGTPAWRPPSC
jgi:hypothetical protein